MWWTKQAGSPPIPDLWIPAYTLVDLITRQSGPLHCDTVVSQADRVSSPTTSLILEQIDPIASSIMPGL